MKVGGSRELVIPPALGYGCESPSSKIPVNSTLVFTINLTGLADPRYGLAAAPRPGPGSASWPQLDAPQWGGKALRSGAGWLPAEE